MNIFRRILNNLEPTERLKYVGIVLFKCFTSLLDLGGLYFLGQATAILSGKPLSSVGFISYLSILKIDQQNSALLFFGLVAALFFVCRGLIAIVANNLLARTLADIETRKSLQLLDFLANKNRNTSEGWSEKEINAAINRSSTQSYNFVLMALSVIASEITLFVAICTFLAITNLIYFLLMAAYFSTVAFLIQSFVNYRAQHAGKQLSEQTIVTEGLVQDFYNLLRQIRMSGTYASYRNTFEKSRRLRSDSQAQINNLMYLPRYILEAALMVGLSIILLIKSLSGTEALQLTVLTVFIAGALRMIGSLVPLQATFSSLKSVQYETSFSIDLEKEFSQYPLISELGVQTSSRKPVIEIKDVSYSYKQEGKPIFTGLSVKIPFGKYVGLVGKSGSGKSTLSDLLLGLLEPSRGEISIAGVSPVQYIKHNPSLVAYVPQKSYLLRGTIFENVTLEFGKESLSIDQVEQALRQVKLLDFVRTLPQGIFTRIGDGFRELSGGQAQRICLARALVRQPLILILDEVTSSLDSGLKKDVDDLVRSLTGSMTVIEITHEIKKVKNFDMVVRI